MLQKDARTDNMKTVYPPQTKFAGGIKTWRNLLTFDQNVRTVYSSIRPVYPNKNHVTTHPGICKKTEVI